MPNRDWCWTLGGRVLRQEGEQGDSNSAISTGQGRGHACCCQGECSAGDLHKHRESAESHGQAFCSSFVFSAIARSSRKRWAGSSLSMTPPSGQAEPSKKKLCFQMTLKSWTTYWEKSGISGTRCVANLWKGESSPSAVPAALVCQELLSKQGRQRRGGDSMGRLEDVTGT